MRKITLYSFSDGFLNIIVSMIKNLNRRIISFNWFKIIDTDIVCAVKGCVIAINCILNGLIIILINPPDTFGNNCPFNKSECDLFIEKINRLYPQNKLIK
jgi:hypothetical protein